MGSGSDTQMASSAHIWALPESPHPAAARGRWGHVTYKTVDTCAAEFEAKTPYFYSTYEDESEAPAAGDRTVMVLGSGPNRIGQGIEFDYCCVHAAFALEDAATRPSWSTATRNRLDRLRHVDAPLLRAAHDRGRAGRRRCREARSRDRPAGRPDTARPGPRPRGCRGQRRRNTTGRHRRAEDRERFSALCAEIGVAQPPHGTATSVAEALDVIDAIGLPALFGPRTSWAGVRCGSSTPSRNCPHISPTCMARARR